MQGTQPYELRPSASAMTSPVVPLQVLQQRNMLFEPIQILTHGLSFPPTVERKESTAVFPGKGGGRQFFSEAQGPEPRQKREEGGPAQRQAIQHQDFFPAEPMADRLQSAPQQQKRRLRAIQTAEPAVQRGSSGNPIGIFDHGCRRLPRTAFQEMTPQGLAAGDEAVMGVGKRELRQEGEGLVAGPAPAAASRNPIVIFVVSLFATIAMAYN
jgi:hypothetical protein